MNKYIKKKYIYLYKTDIKIKIYNQILILYYIVMHVDLEESKENYVK